MTWGEKGGSRERQSRNAPGIIVIIMICSSPVTVRRGSMRSCAHLDPRRAWIHRPWHAVQLGSLTAVASSTTGKEEGMMGRRCTRWRGGPVVARVTEAPEDGPPLRFDFIVQPDILKGSLFHGRPTIHRRMRSEDGQPRGPRVHAVARRRDRGGDRRPGRDILTHAESVDLTTA